MLKPLNSRDKERVATLINYFEQEQDYDGLYLPLNAVRKVSADVNSTFQTHSAIICLTNIF